MAYLHYPYCYLCSQASDILGDESFRDYALEQINYALGSSGRSFVVGFGTNPPKKPHHRSSSCPDAPDVCDWGNVSMPGPNTRCPTNKLKSVKFGYCFEKHVVFYL